MTLFYTIYINIYLYIVFYCWYYCWDFYRITGIGAGLLTITLLSYLGVDIKKAVAVCMVIQLFHNLLLAYITIETCRYIYGLTCYYFSFFGIWIGSYLVKKIM